MMDLKKGEINISFSNHTFNLHLNEGESIDIRLKNDKGNIYMGQADGNSDNTVNHKINGYSSVGLSESTQKEDTQNHLVQPEEITSSIHKILESEENKNQNNNKKENQESETKETTYQDDDKDVVEEEEQSISNNNDDNSKDEVEISDNVKGSQEEEDKDENLEESTSNILNRYMPLDDDEEE
jgi:enoyl reductase-like protein